MASGPYPSTLGRRLAIVLCALATVVGAGWRLIDLAEWPYPFFPTVQYESALAARALWRSADPAARTPEREAWFAEARFAHVVSPPLLPALVAATYIAAGEEIPWASKLFAAGFWAGAGWLLFAAVARQSGSPWGGAAALGFVTFAPFGLLVSRSFQTESVLVCALAYCALRLSRPGSAWGWRAVAGAGLACGAAALVKPGALLPMLGVGFAAVLASARGAGPPAERAGKAVAFGALCALPSVAYVLAWLGHRGGELQPALLGEASYYGGLWRLVRVAAGQWPLALGLAGALIAARRGAPLALGLFAGHAAFCGLFTYHCSTHDYYHTTLLVPVALGVGQLAAEAARLAGGLAERLEAGPRRAEWLVATLFAAGLARFVVVSHTPWAGPWRHTPAVRAGLGAEHAAEARRAELARSARAAMRPGGRAVAVTADYGYILEYWAGLRVAPWPRASDAAFLARAGLGDPGLSAAERLDRYAAAGFDTLIVTDPAEFERQPELKRALAGRARAVIAGPELLVFDLAGAGSREPPPAGAPPPLR